MEQRACAAVGRSLGKRDLWLKGKPEEVIISHFDRQRHRDRDGDTRPLRLAWLLGGVAEKFTWPQSPALVRASEGGSVDGEAV
jgi:hypothetical protein